MSSNTCKGFTPQTKAHKTPNEPELKSVTEKYISLGLSILPIAPKNTGNKPVFTGKNPSFLDEKGKAHLIKHSEYQGNQPTLDQLKVWFANSNNGLGILCQDRLRVIDLDAKNFDSQEECERVVNDWLAEHPELDTAQIERTPSGGFHILVKFEESTDFTNFAFCEGGPHVGELLGSGKFCVMFPTKRYEIEQEGDFATVKSAESIGLYSTRKAKKQKVNQSPSITGVLSLIDLVTPDVKAIYQGQSESGDNSADLTKLINESFGWVNWLTQQNLPCEDPLSFFQNAANKLGIDSSRADRIKDSVDMESCLPACVYEGGDEAAWKKIGKLNPQLGGDYEETRDLLSFTNEEPPQLFSDELFQPLNQLASNLGVPVEIFQACILPILASCLWAKTTLLLNPGTNHLVPPILWLGLVGESGTMKSPILKALLAGLKLLQKAEWDRYLEAHQSYESDHARWKAQKKEDRGVEPKPPLFKDILFNDYTIEAIADSINKDPDSGYLIFQDELASFVNSMDSYRGGKGSDRQQWLSTYNGDSWKVNRKSKPPIFIPQTSLSVVGGIQPQVIERQVSTDKTSEDGLLARFLFVRLPMTTPPGISDKPLFDITPFLEKLYRRLKDLEARQYRLAPDATPMWNAWNTEMGDLIKQEPSNMARAALPKLQEAVARIALTTHVVNGVLQCMSNPALAGSPITSIPVEISTETLSSAIQFTRWLRGQTIQLYSEIGISDKSSSRFIRFINRFQGCGWIKARTVTQWWGSKNRPDAQGTREFMSQIVALGYAIDNGKPVNDSKYQIKITVSTSQSALNTVGDKSVGISWEKVGYHPNRLKAIEDGSYKNSVGNVGTFLEQKDSTESQRGVFKSWSEVAADYYGRREVCDDNF